MTVAKAIEELDRPCGHPRRIGGVMLLPREDRGCIACAFERVSRELAQAHDRIAKPEGWLRAIDEALVVSFVGVADPSDTYEQALKKLHELIEWHVAIAIDPAVNGGFKLMPADSKGWQKIGDAHPAPHARYFVRRDGVTFTAIPCYGTHSPWWVVQIMGREREADPEDMMDTDEWRAYTTEEEGK